MQISGQGFRELESFFAASLKALSGDPVSAAEDANQVFKILQECGVRFEELQEGFVRSDLLNNSLLSALNFVLF